MGKECSVNPSLGLFDMDGTIVPYLYGKEELLKNYEKMRKEMEKLEPFPWVTEEGIIQAIDELHIITGRGKQEENLTKRWFVNKLKLSDYIYHPIEWKNKQQYVADKVNTIIGLYEEWRSRYPHSNVVIMEDDGLVLKELLERIDDPCVTLISVDRETGKLTKLL